MQMTLDIGYDQVYELARQLPPRDRRRLAETIVPAEPETSPSDAEPRQDLIVLERHDGLVVLQVPFPDTEEGRIRQQKQEQMQKEYREAHPELFVERSKEEIEQNRQDALRLMDECPVATQEDIDYLDENLKEFRRLFRCRPT
jgi:hypothetical protein